MTDPDIVSVKRQRLLATAILGLSFAVATAILVFFPSSRETSDPDSNSFWIEWLSQSDDSAERLAGASVLSWRLDHQQLAPREREAVSQALTRALDDKDAGVRFQALAGLDKDGNVRQIAKNMLSDEDWRVRSLAAQLAAGQPLTSP